MDPRIAEPHERFGMDRDVGRTNVHELDRGERGAAAPEQRQDADEDSFGSPHGQPPSYAGLRSPILAEVQPVPALRVVIRGDDALARVVVPPSCVQNTWGGTLLFLPHFTTRSL